MTLGKLIQFLERMDPDRLMEKGFHNPHSYRGYYDQLAFEPADDVTVERMLAEAKRALGNTYTGWKGGEFTMDANTIVNVAPKGSCTMDGDGMAEFILDNWNIGDVLRRK